VATWPEPLLLAEVRRSLAEADDALLCVAFANAKGVNLLGPQLGRLGSRCRLVVTSTFGGETTATALGLAAGLGVAVRVLNPSASTFHPKLYLARKRPGAVAVVGSANLTGGLVSNIEAAVVMTGTAEDHPIADAWSLGEGLWRHPSCLEWSPRRLPLPPEELDAVLLDKLRKAVPPGSVVPTLTGDRPNTVTDVSPQGLYVETNRSRAKGTAPRLVPAWMLQLAWDYLRARGTLTNRYLLATDGLNVKRSSAVCAVLARLPEVEVTCVRPISLRLRAPTRPRPWPGHPSRGEHAVPQRDLVPADGA
jgi:hypothetical protein